MSETKENIIDEEAAVPEAVESAEETTDEATEPVTAENESPASDLHTAKKSKAPLVTVLCALIAIVLGAVVFTFGSGTDKTFDPLFYVGDDGLYMKDLGSGKKAAVRVCEINSEDTYLINLLFNTELTEAVFGLQDENGITLYSYDLTDKSAAPKKIAEDVNSFIKDESTGVVTCITGKESKLIQLDAELNETVIAEAVDYFEASADGLSLMYSNNNDETFLKQKDKDAVMLTRDGSIEYSDENLSVFYILEDNSLYKVQPSGERTLIDKGVSSTTFEAADGYYFKTSKTVLIKDLFDDDMAEADNEIKIPEDTSSEAYTLYTDRLARDQIRTIIINPETSYLIQDVYYYDGNESKEVIKDVFGDEFEYYNDFSVNSSVATLNCSVIDTGKIKKVRMSELWEVVSDGDFNLIGGMEDVTELITDPLIEYCTDYFVYKGDYAAALDIKGVIFDSMLDGKNNVLYITVGDSLFSDAVLYRIPLTETGLGEPEVICESVNSLETMISEDGKLYYLEDTYNNDESLLAISKVYFDSKLIAENVSNVLEYDLEKGTFFIEKYLLKEDGTPDTDNYAYETVLYNTVTGEEIHLNTEEGEYYYELYETPAGKTVLLESSYDFEETTSNVYSIVNGNKKLLATIGDPEYFRFMYEFRDGTGYFEWDDDEEFWSEDGFTFDYDMWY